MFAKSRFLAEVFLDMKDKFNEGDLYSEDYWNELDIKCLNYNAKLYVFDKDTYEILISSDRLETNSDMSRLDPHILNEPSKTVLKNENYVIEVHNVDAIGTDFINLRGILPDGNVVLIRTPVESVTIASSISNRFLIVIGIIFAFISVFVSRFTAKKLARPINELSQLSEKMCTLDFESKYVSRGINYEIDQFGQNMNELSETLEKTIKELRQANIQLQTDLKVREETEKMRKDFFANASHELKTPLALIQGYAEGLVDGAFSDPEDFKFYCDVIIDESKKMNRLVCQMISLNQLEYKENVMSVDRFNLTDMINSILDANKLLIEQYDANVIFSETKSIYIWADEFSIEQVITNYLTNALHYAKGDKLIKISVEEREHDIVLNFYNRGDLIPEENLPFIWDKFYKSDQSRSREYGGSGIGLSIVKTVMERLKKNYGVKNLSDGVLFWVELDK